MLLKDKDDFCCASIFSPALPSGSTLHSVWVKKNMEMVAKLFIRSEFFSFGIRRHAVSVLYVRLESLYSVFQSHPNTVFILHG